MLQDSSIQLSSKYTKSTLNLILESNTLHCGILIPITLNFSERLSYFGRTGKKIGLEYWAVPGSNSPFSNLNRTKPF